jgi:hypothetical protein
MLAATLIGLLAMLFVRETAPVKASNASAQVE